MKAIINADDLGINPEVSEAIFHCMAQGRITSVTMMANGVAVAARERQLNHRTVELMGHPGVAGFEDETRLLGTDWWRELPIKIEPINHDEL